MFFNVCTWRKRLAGRLNLLCIPPLPPGPATTAVDLDGSAAPLVVRKAVGGTLSSALEKVKGSRRASLLEVRAECARASLAPLVQQAAGEGSAAAR